MATGVRLRHQDLSYAFTSRSQDDKMATGTGLEAERSVLHLLSRAGQEAANTGLFYHQQDLQKHAATEYSTTAECSLLALLSVCLPRGVVDVGRRVQRFINLYAPIRNRSMWSIRDNGTT